MNIADTLTGATRVIAIIGDPIAQVKSPSGVTQSLIDRGCNGVVVPLQVHTADLEALVLGLGRARNFDGLIVTVPHKFDIYRLCATATERAHFLGAVNVLRRNADGSWHGDHADGVGFVQSLRAAGCEPKSRRALLVGAGGAGSAIALALLDAGVAALSIHDGDTLRRDALIARLRPLHGERVTPGGHDPSGYDLAVNATPAGMRANDPLPLDVSKLSPATFVGDVITLPAVTPLIAAARERGCGTQIGTGMFAAVCEHMVDFLFAAGPLAEAARIERT